MTSLLELRETIESHTFVENHRAALRFLSHDLNDPDMRRTILTAQRLTLLPELEPVFMVGNLFENAGCLVKNGVIDADMVCDLLSAIVSGAWKAYAPFIAHRRMVVGDALYENFEYLAVLSDDWLTAHPHGSYPRGMRRMELCQTWPEVTALASRAHVGAEETSQNAPASNLDIADEFGDDETSADELAELIGDRGAPPWRREP